MSSSSKKNAGTRVNYWLMKSEPEVFSIKDLEKAPGQTTHWDGVRNYQARNFMRDQMQVGDLLFFYHSNSNPPGIAGIAQIAKAGYPDHTAFDPENIHFDPKSKTDTPTWYMVDVKHVETFPSLLSLEMLKNMPELEDMVLLQKGSRLSVQPVTQKQWQIINKISKNR
jgi:predicted RNA-binding protein with PUA-like domain